MKITKRQLRKIIRENMAMRMMNQDAVDDMIADDMDSKPKKRKVGDVEIVDGAFEGTTDDRANLTDELRGIIQKLKDDGKEAQIPKGADEILAKNHGDELLALRGVLKPSFMKRMMGMLFPEGTARLSENQLRNLVRESIIREMKPFRMPDSYYDPPDGEEIPEAVEAALEDIYNKAASSPNKEHMFSGPGGDYTLIDETEAGGDVLPAYILRDPKGGEEQFDIEIQSEMDKLEDLLTDILMQNYQQEQDDFEAEYRSY